MLLLYCRTVVVVVVRCCVGGVVVGDLLIGIPKQRYYLVAALTWTRPPRD